MLNSYKRLMTVFIYCIWNWIAVVSYSLCGSFFGLVFPFPTS